MNKSLIFVSLFSFLYSANLVAQVRSTETDAAIIERQRIENEYDSLQVLADKISSKPKYKFGGRVEARVFYDSYTNVDSRDGAIYYFPKAPLLNSNGVDLNNDGQVRFSAFTTRLNFSVSNVKVGSAKLDAFIEGDFLGSNDVSLQMLRLRHAYVKLDWEQDQLLLGQTSNLSFVDEVQSNTVMFGAGIPYNVLNRGVMARYMHAFRPNVKLLFAAEYYTAHKSVGPSNAQSKAMIPDLRLQLKLGDPNRVFGGVTVGAKFLQPFSVDEKDNKVNAIATSMDFSAFFRANIQDYIVQLYAIYGGNLSELNCVGGYGLTKNHVTGDYQYTATRTVSTWLDIETPTVNKFQFGFFFGHQYNLGSTKALDLTKSNGEFKYGFFRNNDIVWYSRIAPRIYYNPIPKLSFGIEYSYNMAVWGKKFDEYYKATETHPQTANNRVELLARFNF